MTDKSRTPDEIALDELFAAGRTHRIEPSDDFMARLARDAEAAAPSFEWATSTVPSRPSIWARASGWMTATGLAGSTVLGVWIGMTSPDLLNDAAFLDATGEDVALSDFLPWADLSSVAEIGADG